MKKVIIIALALAGLTAAAEAPVQRIVPVKNGDPSQIYVTVHDLMQGQVNVRQYQNNIVLNGSSEAVAAAEQLIKNLENSAPRERDFELTGYIVLAIAQAGETGNTPAELEPVLKQFRTVLNYKSFRVLDTILLRGKENANGPYSEGFLALPNTPPPGARDTFRIARATITDDVVHLRDMGLHVWVPYTSSKGELLTRDVQLSTDADVKVGQKVAIGKASVDPNGNALILVISANVVN